MVTMDINQFIQQNSENLSSEDRQELMYYIDNAINNFSASLTKRPEMANIMGQFGSTNSTDIDLFFLLKDQKEEYFTRKIEQFFEHNISAAIGNDENVKKLDITFITTKHGVVNWSNKGNPAIINNAIFHTYKTHIFNYDIGSNAYRDIPVTSEIKLDIGLKAMSNVRQVLSVISRTHHGKISKRLLINKSFKARCDAIKTMIEETGLFSSIEPTVSKNESGVEITTGLGKNQSDAELLKDVAFSFIQLDAMLNNSMMPYTKNAVFNTGHTQLLPFVFEMADFTNSYSLNTTALDNLILECINKVVDLIDVDGEGVVSLRGDMEQYDLRKEEIV